MIKWKTTTYPSTFIELIARHLMENNKGVKYKAAPLLDKTPVVGADIIMQGIDEVNYIDVKGVKSDGRRLMVNFKAHNNPKKKVTHYMQDFAGLPINR